MSRMSFLLALATSLFGFGLVRAAEETQSKFKYNGGCQIRCIDGKCEFITVSGLVYDDTILGAKVKAEADLKARASARGTVVEGTVNLTVEFDLYASDTRTGRMSGEVEGSDSTETAITQYSWTVWAHSLRDGDYGHHTYSVNAPNAQAALNQLSIYQLAWGQQLGKQGRHYNSIESRPN